MNNSPTKDLDHLQKIKTITSIKTITDLDKIFVSLKVNNKKPQYNFVSGMVCGILISKTSMVKGLIECGTEAMDSQKLKELITDIIDMIKKLVEEYNWKKDNVIELGEFFK